MSFQPDSHLLIEDCNILGNCANGKCLIAAYLQALNAGKLRGGELDNAIADCIVDMVAWSHTTNQVLKYLHRMIYFI